MSCVPFWKGAGVLEVAPSPWSNCQRSTIILWIMYAVIGYPNLNFAVNKKCRGKYSFVHLLRSEQPAYT